jgi:hypothetical protein
MIPSKDSLTANNHKARVNRMKREYESGGEVERSIFMCISLLSDDFWNEHGILQCKNKSGVYVISVLDKYYKIGSSKNIYNRILSIERALPFGIKVVKIIETKAYLTLEKFLRSKFKHKKIKTEWFHLTTQDIIEMEALLYAFGDNI